MYMKLVRDYRTDGHDDHWGSGGFNQESDNFLFLFSLMAMQEHSAY